MALRVGKKRQLCQKKGRYREIKLQKVVKCRVRYRTFRLKTNEGRLTENKIAISFYRIPVARNLPMKKQADDLDA